MDFVSIRLITDRVSDLVQFYEKVTTLAAVRHTEDFAELRLPSCTLAIASTRTTPLFGSGLFASAHNRSTIIEFRVAHVDATFERLRTFVREFVMEPTTMPWGNRSLLFRDPDGNLINLFTPITPEAIQRFTRP